MLVIQYSIFIFSVPSNAVLHVEATDANASFTLSYDYDVTNFGCDEIVIATLGIDAQMSRK